MYSRQTHTEKVRLRKCALSRILYCRKRLVVSYGLSAQSWPVMGILTPMSQMYLRSIGELPRQLPNLVFVILGHVGPRCLLDGHVCILKSSNKTPEQTGI